MKALHMFVNHLKRFLLKDICKELETQRGIIKNLSDIVYHQKLQGKEERKLIRVLFVVHESTGWRMFDSIYKCMSADHNFSPKVVCLPCSREINHGNGEKLSRLVSYLESLGIPSTPGYSLENNTWIHPIAFQSDFVFFQTPYHFFPEIWSAAMVSLHSKVCYIPYGTCLFKGEVEESVHPLSFFRHVHLFFLEGVAFKEKFIRHFGNEDWCAPERIVPTGLPKLDDLVERESGDRPPFQDASGTPLRTILWTPRWRTDEGTCHFFDYSEYFMNFCGARKKARLLLRQHPLALENFLKTGEISRQDWDSMVKFYEAEETMRMDDDPDYRKSFRTSDILVSDISSLLFEFSMTGKPVIYTHRTNLFNEMGESLAGGFYWVKNEKELNQTLEMLLSGEDPLKAERERIRKKIFGSPGASAGKAIASRIAEEHDFLSRTI